MKSTLFLGLFLFLTLAGVAQESDTTAAVAPATETKKDSVDIGKMISDMFNTEIEISIDKSVFNKSMGKNMFYSEERQAFIMMIVLPSSIDKADEKLEKERKKKEGYKSLGHGSYFANGKKIVFENGSMKKEGKKMLMDMYMIEAGESASIFLIGAYLPNDKEFLASKIRESANSAQLPKK